MTSVPTRWRSAVRDQLDNALQRVARAEQYLEGGDGGRAMQETYPAVIAGATIRVWLDLPPWLQVLSTDEMRRQIQQRLPSLFAAVTEIDVQQVLTSPWRVADARPYVKEATAYVQETEAQVAAWLEDA